MSPEEMQRTMQFLLHEQARFAAELAQNAAESAAWRKQFEGSMTALSDKTDQIADGLLGLTALVGRVVDKVEQLADSQERTQQQLAETDHRLNVVVDMFERHLREDHGRKPS